MTFNEDYYQRYYTNPRTRVISPAALDRTVEFLCAYLAYLELDISRILDIGCGTGEFLKRLSGRLPKATCEGVELSEYACTTYGWSQGSVVDYDAQNPFDLVVCNDVFQYLTNEDAERGIRTLERLSSEALFFTVLTTGDWETNCDQTRTDGDVHLRRHDWYRQRLGNHFRNLGGGLWLRKSSETITYDLESF